MTNKEIIETLKSFKELDGKTIAPKYIALKRKNKKFCDNHIKFTSLGKGYERTFCKRFCAIKQYNKDMGVSNSFQLHNIKENQKKYIYLCDNIDNINIEVNNRSIIKPKEIDLVINNKVAIEIQGDYWHANPEKYNENEYIREKSVKDIWNNDKLKKDLITNLGYEYITIFENDFNKNKNEFLKKVLKCL